ASGVNRARIRVVRSAVARGPTSAFSSRSSSCAHASPFAEPNSDRTRAPRPAEPNPPPEVMVAGAEAGRGAGTDGAEVRPRHTNTATIATTTTTTAIHTTGDMGGQPTGGVVSASTAGTV